MDKAPIYSVIFVSASHDRAPDVHVVAVGTDPHRVADSVLAADYIDTVLANGAIRVLRETTMVVGRAVEVLGEDDDYEDARLLVSCDDFA